MTTPCLPAAPRGPSNPRPRPLAATLALALLVVGCARTLDEKELQRAAEKLFVEVNTGFSVAKREPGKSRLVRGDQVYTLDVAALHDGYLASKQSGGDFLDDYRARLVAEAAARRVTVDKAGARLWPYVKGGVWVRAQDMGAIGPPSVQQQLRPWRQPLAEDVFVVLGVSEALFGTRYLTQAELATSPTSGEKWVEAAVKNLAAAVDTATGSVELRAADGRLLVLDMPNLDGVSGLVLDRGFREKMLARFGLPSLGASVPNRDVLILFDPDDVSTRRPVRARTHQLHDERNHPGFRGLLRLSREGLAVLEPAHPEKEKAAP